MNEHDDDRIRREAREIAFQNARANAGDHREPEGPLRVAESAEPHAASPGRGPEGEQHDTSQGPRQPTAVGPGRQQPAPAEDTRSALFVEVDASDYEARWQQIQTAFVDDPRLAVQRADELVAEMMKRLTETFARERAGLEQQWDRGEDVSTEDLRLALRRYRSFFGRLLAI